VAEERHRNQVQENQDDKHQRQLHLQACHVAKQKGGEMQALMVFAWMAAYIVISHTKDA
jgi:hypothetical protein